MAFLVRRVLSKKHATMVVRPSGSHDSGGGGERGAAQIASGCMCTCTDWCAEGDEMPLREWVDQVGIDAMIMCKKM